MENDGYWYICMDCGRTVKSVNKDGECELCELETDILRYECMRG